MEELTEGILLVELAKNESLSRRAINICNKNEIYTLFELLEYYKKNRSFKKIENCGALTNSQLVFICKKYKSLAKTENKLEIDSLNKGKNINNFEMDVSLEILQIKYSMTKRAFNLCDSNGLNSFKKIYHYYKENSTFLRLNNCGHLTNMELEELCEKVRNPETDGKIDDFIGKIQNTEITNKPKLNQQLRDLMVNIGNSVSFFNSNVELELIFNQDEKLKLFSFINYLIKHENFFTLSNETDVFSYYFLLSSETKNHLSLKSLENNLNLSASEIIQIVLRCEKILYHKLNIIIKMVSEFCLDYPFLKDKEPLIILNKKFYEEINKSENVTFNQDFYELIYGRILNKSHVLLENKVNKTYKFNEGKYFVEREYYRLFSFTNYLSKISFIINSKIPSALIFSFDKFLLEFFKMKISKELYEKYFNRLNEICRKLILSEFNIVVNTEGCIVFERNTKKQIFEFIVEILESKNELMKNRDIVNSLLEKYPDITINENTIRNAVLREKNIFITVGRNSMYGLKKWEIKNENIKGGTIRDIVEEFLLKSKSPKHISEILHYLNKYRNTNERSVLTNLEMEVNNRFKFFSGGFIGLKNKKYILNESNFKALNGNHFRDVSLRKVVGWVYEEAIKYYVSRYNYLPIQIKYVFQKKMDLGVLSLSKDNKIRLSPKKQSNTKVAKTKANDKNDGIQLELFN